VPGDDEDGAAHRDDDASAIGRSYRQQDEIGTPCCITRELGSLNDHVVTVRERDSCSRSGSASARFRAVWPNRSRAADCPRPRSSVAALHRVRAADLL
jgi:hypothetical protein